MSLKVTTYFTDGTSSVVSQGVDAISAFTTWNATITGPDVSAGTVTRILITDDNDNIAADWEKKRGIIFPRKDSVDQFNANRPDDQYVPPDLNTVIQDVFDGFDPADPAI